MKTLIATLLSFFLFYAPVTGEKHHAGKCTGAVFCTACKNCSACKYCHSGGTCGICARAKPKQEETPDRPVEKEETSTAQCKAITKKGIRCSRRATSAGYCWQHGN